MGSSIALGFVGAGAVGLLLAAPTAEAEDKKPPPQSVPPIVPTDPVEIPDNIAHPGYVFSKGSDVDDLQAPGGAGKGVQIPVAPKPPPSGPKGIPTPYPVGSAKEGAAPEESERTPPRR